MSRSEQLFEQAQRYIPGGVNSPVRACQSVGTTPLFIAKASGSRIESVDGQSLIDYVLSWGPMLLGHSHPEVVAAAEAALRAGSSFGAPCPAEIDLAKAVVEALPAMDMARMVSSGTEATMSALRLARAVTGRSKVIKFVGCYHGHADPFLAAAGSGLATLSIPGTPGVPPATVADTLLAPYNDLAAVGDLFEKMGEEIACVIVEPVAGNMGLVLPDPEFLPGLRDLTLKYESLLILDEVITGFRVGFSGAQGRFDVTPDLTTLGKIVGGGFPVGVYGGRRELMERVAPCGDVYQAGTLSGNPVAMAAGLATLRLLAQADYAALEARTAKLAADLTAVLAAKGVPVAHSHIASLFTLWFAEEAPRDFASAKKADAVRYASFYRQMREAGVYLAPSAFETAFTSFAHSEEDFAKTLEAAEKVRL